MSVKLGALILYSRHPQELAQFFSDLLDMDIQTDEATGAITVSSDILKLMVLEANADQMFHRSGERDMLLELEYDTQQELEDLLFKVQFLSYRQGEYKEKKATLTKMGDDIFFFLKDLDGRRWKFSTKISS